MPDYVLFQQNVDISSSFLFMFYTRFSGLEADWDHFYIYCGCFVMFYQFSEKIWHDSVDSVLF